jgi:hypothetical protein
MLDDMDSGVKVLVIILVIGIVLVLAVPLIVILAAVIASFVLGLGSEAALLLPVCGPAFASRVRASIRGLLDRSTLPGVASGDGAAE